MSNFRPFHISGTGCSLVDHLYSPVDFLSPHFQRFFSRNAGDGGLSPGRLVFMDDLETYAGLPYKEVKERITGGKQPIKVNIGGPSVVPLIHAAQILRESAEILLYGCRGDDRDGEYLQGEIALTPLNAVFRKVSDQSTPFTHVLADPSFDGGHGERIFINHLGAAAELDSSDLDDRFFQSDMTVFGGTALVPEIHRNLGDLLQKARSRGCITMVNTVYDFLSERSDPGGQWKLGTTSESYGLIDIMITDKEEALRLSGAGNTREALDFFRSGGVGCTIITQGREPVWFYSRGELFGSEEADFLPVSARIIEENRVHCGRKGDTTGCGDNFTGGVIASVARQLMDSRDSQISLREAVTFGIVSGGFACFYYGGTYREEYPGQKSELIMPYLTDYKKQVHKM